ncbi:hypothetical protein ACXGQW_11460 [Wenyingzhuangia sp. IMCC45533]
MKTSYKILSICLLFVIAGITIDKYFIYKKYKNYSINGDREDKMISDLTHYKYLVLDGMNVARVAVRTKSNISKTLYKHSEQNNFKKYIKNDTLYISYNQELREHNLKKYTGHRIQINNNKLEYVSIKNADAKIFARDRNFLKIEANYSADLKINTKDVDSLFVSVGNYSKANVNSKELTLPFLDINAFGNGVADLRELKVDLLKQKTSEQGRIFSYHKD